MITNPNPTPSPVYSDSYLSKEKKILTYVLINGFPQPIDSDMDQYDVRDMMK